MSNDQFGQHRPEGADATKPADETHVAPTTSGPDGAVTRKEANEAREILALDEPMTAATHPVEDAPGVPAPDAVDALNLPPTMSGTSEITGYQNPLYETQTQGGLGAFDGFNQKVGDAQTQETRTEHALDSHAAPRYEDTSAASLQVPPAGSPYGHPAEFGTDAPVSPDASPAEKAGSGLDPERPYGTPVPPVYGSADAQVPTQPNYAAPAPYPAASTPGYGAPQNHPYGASSNPTVPPAPPAYGEQSQAYPSAPQNGYGQPYPVAPQDSYHQLSQSYEDAGARSSASTSHWAAILVDLFTFGFLGWIVPLVILNGAGQRNAFAAHHARQSLNLELTFVIVLVANLFLSIFGLGFIGILAGIAVLVLQIMGAVKANSGERFNIPAIPFFKDQA